MSACKVSPPLLSHLHSPPQALESKTLASILPLEPPRIRSRSRSRCGSRRRSLVLLPLPLSALLLLPPNSSSAVPPSFDPVSDSEKDASAAVSSRVSEAVRLLDVARGLQAKGDFPQALDYFTLVIKDYKDFAFSEYARVGRALLLYEIGDREEAITEMEDISISLKGYPEIHAALAAALYVDKHAPLLAENQFTIATLLDPHYTDLSYVRETKHWPPSLVIKDYKDFAFSEYARVGRALLLYEIGDREEAITEMEDISISLKGYPEIHAALAATLYVDKHAPLLAENQFTIATLLDPHYMDLSYVRETKHWPPSLVSSLQHFITLS